jgi:hypothetical protein
MTERKLATNRKNALKSTGPRTLAGKQISSRNAVKHGMLATGPILAGLESRDAGKEHRNGIFESLSPIGYLEDILVERIALLAWRTFMA